MAAETTRRSFIGSAATTLVLSSTATPALAHHRERRLHLRNLHTDERIELSYWRDGDYDRGALRQLDHFLRDWRTGDTLAIDPKLHDLTYEVAWMLGVEPRFDVVCGYRSPTTNEMLRKRGHGVARKSMHLVGKAIDLRLEDVSLPMLREAALACSRGGVGYYPRSNFVHLDTGRPRQWRG